MKIFILNENFIKYFYDSNKMDPVETYLSNLSDKELDALLAIPSYPKYSNYLRFTFDPVLLYKHKMSPRIISERLSKFLDCDFVYSPLNEGIMDVYYNLPSDVIDDISIEGYSYMVKNIFMSFELSGIIGISYIYPKKEKDGSFCLETRGSNLRAVMSLDDVQSNQNNIKFVMGSYFSIRYRSRKNDVRKSNKKNYLIKWDFYSFKIYHASCRRDDQSRKIFPSDETWNG